MKLAIYFLMLALLSASPVRADGIAWMTSYGDALTQAHATGKPVLLYVHADYCEYCKQMEREAFVDSRAVLLSTLYVPCRVDGERDGKPLIRKYDIREYPYEAVLDQSGNVLTPAPEYMNPDKYARTLASAVPGATLARLTADAADPASEAALAVIDAETGNIPAAESAAAALPASAAPTEKAAVDHALGVAYFDAKSYDKAAAALSTAAAALGDCHEAVQVDFRLADSYDRLNQPDKAAAVLTSIRQMQSATRDDRKEAEKRLRKE